MLGSSRYRIIAIVALLLASLQRPGAEPLVSPTWGFAVDLPEGYALSEGDGKSRFSFTDTVGKGTATLIAYAPGRYDSPQALLEDTSKRLGASSDVESFDYGGKRAALGKLSFQAPSGGNPVPTEGWALAIDLAPKGTAEDKPGDAPLLLVLGYWPSGAPGAEERALSILDSVSPNEADRRSPGPVTTFSYPPQGRRSVKLSVLGTPVEASVDKADQEAAKYLVTREFRVLSAYASSPLWQAAWKRFYRAIWKDSYERLEDVAFAVERALASTGRGDPRALAEGVLAWIQSFKYERDLLGTDFIDLPSAAIEGRGDCDSRALLMAVVLQHANLDAILMVSREYSHAMAGVDVAGTGARFKTGGREYMVAETTAVVPLGRIGSDVADPAKWLGVDFPGLPPTK